MNKLFADFASWSAWATGHAYAFALATAACIVWAATGPMFTKNARDDLIESEKLSEKELQILREHREAVGRPTSL